MSSPFKVKISQPESKLRRKLLTAAVLSPIGAPLLAQSAGSIVIGQSAALTGPVAGQIVATVAASKAYFDEVNSRGGIGGKLIKLITLDDGLVAARTVENVKRLVSEERCAALFSCVGTANNLAIKPILEKTQLPHVAPLTGASSVRQGPDCIFHVRAGFANEVEHMVSHMVPLGINRLGVICQEGPFGDDVLAALRTALKARNVELQVVATIKPDGSDAAAAAKKVAGVDLAAVILFTLGTASYAAMNAIIDLKPGMPLYGLSVLGGDETLKIVKARKLSLSVTQVMPLPWDKSMPVIREYLTLMNAAGHGGVTLPGVEGFINAKLLTEGLRRAKGDYSKASLRNAFSNLRDIDLGGFVVSFGESNRYGSNWVNMTLLSASGKYIG